MLSSQRDNFFGVATIGVIMAAIEKATGPLPKDEVISTDWAVPVF